jgi:hypothetical protein
MSPVSRGRKKKRSRQQPEPEWIDDDYVDEWIDQEPEDTRQQPSWFATSIKAVLDGTDSLVGATGPRELEQATCELIGAQLYRAVYEERSGLSFDWWFKELTVAAAATIREADDLGGEWRLLHGLAAVGSPTLRSFVRHQVNSLLRIVRRRPAFTQQPRWLGMSHQVKATGEVWRLQDAYGTRLAILAAMTYQHNTSQSVFLFDIDTCGFTTLVHAGAYDDVPQAAAAWRTLVGDAADGADPVEVRTGEQLSSLAYLDTAEGIMGDETRDRLDNWFRANRCIHDLAHALRKSALLWPPPTSLYDDLNTEPLVNEFSAWYADQHGTEPDPEAVEALAEEWLEGILPSTQYLVSPHRTTFHRVLIDDNWIPDHPGTEALKSTVEPWVRWLGTKSGLSAELIDRAVLGNPSDETP